MLRITPHPNGIVTFQSDKLTALGVPHAFTTRVEKMNFAEGAYQHRSIRRLMQTLGVAERFLVRVRQVHGRTAVLFNSPDLDMSCEADAVATVNDQLMVGVSVADCVPVLVACDSGRCAMAIHAGWRGCVSGVVASAIDLVASTCNVDAANLTAAIGPCISVKSYEVGEEVAQAFEQQSLGEAVDRTFGARPHVDLTRAVMLQLSDAGVRAENIDFCNCCSFEDSDYFYSHRREAAASGRMMAVIGVRR